MLRPKSLLLSLLLVAVLGATWATWYRGSQVEQVEAQACVIPPPDMVSWWPLDADIQGPNVGAIASVTSGSIKCTKSRDYRRNSPNLPRQNVVVATSEWYK